MKTSKTSVLVVDDEEGIRDYLRLLLQHAGYDVRTAADGKQALEALRVAPADLIVLDLMMPVLDGWAFLDELRREPGLRAPPVIVLSAIDHPPPMGVSAVLVKPSSPAEIRSAIATALGADRRRAPRFPASFGVQADDSRGGWRGVTHDLSRGGLSFATPRQAGIGQQLTLSLDLPPHGAVLLEAEVRHVGTAPVGWRVGARTIVVRQNADGLDATLSMLEGSIKPP